MSVVFIIVTSGPRRSRESLVLHIDYFTSYSFADAFESDTSSGIGVAFPDPPRHEPRVYRVLIGMRGLCGDSIVANDTLIFHRIVGNLVDYRDRIFAKSQFFCAL